MKKLLFIVSMIFSLTSLADVNCRVMSGWSIQFNSGSQPVFLETYQLLQNGAKSDADVTLQQAYQSPSEFKARVELDGQDIDIRTSLSRRNGEYAIYSGVMTIDNIDQIVTCKQN
jgi:hypothetical protein